MTDLNSISTAENEPSNDMALKELSLGSVAVGFPVVQAALSGYSDAPMRVIARRLGASYTLCEVMLDQFLVAVKARKKNRHFLYVWDEEHPVGGQLMGAEPEQFSAGAVKLVEAGFDVIDINFGCPVKKVLGRCRGGFHLGQPPVALEIIRRTREVVPDQIPVTVKMRRGIDDSAESRDHFFEILDGAFQAGVSAVTVHGRTVKQRYIGPSRWEFLAEVKQHVGAHTILGSGDLFTAQDCLDMIRQTGVDGVTVARGAIGNPWIFNQARALAAGRPLPPPPSIHEQRDVIREHFRLAEHVYGSRCGPQMRKFGIKYSALHPQSHELREAFVRVRCPEDWEAVLDQWYQEDGPGRYPDPAIHRVQSECG
ncbi:MAG: tRNA-dihydrouridine synthase family protein [Planctomycetaceae bacterium]|nr:tRNA-dihydrouridine synthase family protein [Planctomycetaceae bacterium]